MSVDIDGTTYAGEALGTPREITAWQPWLAPLITLLSEPLPEEGFLACSLKVPKVKWFFPPRRS